MGNPHCCIVFLDVLTTSTCGAVRIDPQIIGIDDDRVIIFYLRKDFDPASSLYPAIRARVVVFEATLTDR